MKLVTHITDRYGKIVPWHLTFKIN